jgi:outer membrane lipoprotein LolB
MTAVFDLKGSASDGSLGLSTPLGSMLAQAKWSAGGVTLQTPQGQSSYPDLDSLTHDVLGESVPVGALFDWLRARPWAGASSKFFALPAQGFEQLGWNVHLSRFDDGFVEADRTGTPSVSVRIRLD